MNKKQFIEFVPLALFIVFGLFDLFKIVPYSIWVTLLSGSMLSMLYFYASFWLFSDTGMPVGGRIATGLAFSVSIIACLFCLFRWPFGNIYALASYVGLAVVLVICLVNRNAPWFRQILYRCLFFVLMLSAIYSYRYLLA